MFDLQRQHKKQGREGQRGRRGRPTALAIGAIAAGLALVASLAAMAFASSAPTVSSASSSKLKETIVVSPQGRTVYWLSPESTHHLLCKTNECFKFWPPVTVSSSHAKLVAGSGVSGSLGIVHRNGIFQVTLRGMPLYLYAGDHGKGQVNGQGIKSFGGTWYAVTASSDPSKSGGSTSGGGW